MEPRRFKKGDRVRVWSLQSFEHGGFLNGEPAFVAQSQVGDSVFLSVVRNFDGVYKLDKSYEVYARQCELMEEIEMKSGSYEKAKLDMLKYYDEVMDNNLIS